jgi:hypothetical protein
VKILRSVNRRGFSIGSAGWFSVLKPNTWFPASRLPGAFRYHGGQSVDTPAQHYAAGHQAIVPPRIIILSTQEHHLTRLALVVLAAIGITFLLLLWIMHPNLQ